MFVVWGDAEGVAYQRGHLGTFVTQKRHLTHGLLREVGRTANVSTNIEPSRIQNPNLAVYPPTSERLRL